MNDSSIRFSGSLNTDDEALDPRIIEHDDQRRRRAHEPASPAMTLNMTPMIDVVFLLLIYFVLGSSFQVKEESIVLELPERLEGAAETTRDPFELPVKPIEVRLVSQSDARGDVAISADDALLGGATTLPEFSRALREARQSGALPADQEFAIRPVADARWEHALEALSIVRAGGYENVRLVNPSQGGR